MKKLYTTTFLAAVFVTAAAAQSTNAYIYGAPGGLTGPAKTEATAQVGAGVEVALPKGFGAGVEIAALSPFSAWGESTLGVFSPNAYYHFEHGKEHRFDPFVTGGYTLYFRDGHRNLFNFGGGANLWATRHIGARLELRDQVDTQYETLHYWGVRFGIAFRK